MQEQKKSRTKRKRKVPRLFFLCCRWSCAGWLSVSTLQNDVDDGCSRDCAVDWLSDSVWVARLIEYRPGHTHTPAYRWTFECQHIVTTSPKPSCTLFSLSLTHPSGRFIKNARNTRNEYSVHAQSIRYHTVPGRCVQFIKEKKKYSKKDFFGFFCIFFLVVIQHSEVCGYRLPTSIWTNVWKVGVSIFELSKHFWFGTWMVAAVTAVKRFLFVGNAHGIARQKCEMCLMPFACFEVISLSFAINSEMSAMMRVCASLLLEQPKKRENKNPI